MAGLKVNLLLYGESGSGKDVWAAFTAACRSRGPFVVLHCGDVPETLLESEWFGYRRGAFSGAERDFAGRWAAAEGGTLYLNGIDLLSLNLQAKLLRIVEKNSYFQLGSARETRFDIRFIFSAAADIEYKVSRNLFRPDLFYRISTYSLFVPPLRERQRDIEALLEYFAARESLKLQLTAPARRKLLQYNWPGNIRELENFVRRCAAGSGILDAGQVDSLLDNPGKILENAAFQDWSLKKIQGEYLGLLLKKYKNKSRVASILGISRKSLYNMLKKNEPD